MNSTRSIDEIKIFGFQICLKSLEKNCLKKTLWFLLAFCKWVDHLLVAKNTGTFRIEYVFKIKTLNIPT